MWRVALLSLVVITTAAAFVARLVIVAATRRTWPAVAAATERWWVWTPLVIVCAVAMWTVPLVGIPATIGLLVVLARANVVGSPFRPRR